MPRRKSRAAAVLAVLLAILLLASAILVSPLGRQLLSGISGNSYPAQATIVLHRTLTIDVGSGDIDYSIDLPVPVDVRSGDDLAQDVSLVEEEPVAEHLEKYGQEWLEWSGPLDGAASFDVEYRATVHTLTWDISKEDSGLSSDIPQSLADIQTGDEWEVLDRDGDPTGEYMIWPDNPTIRTLSASLTSPEATVYENAGSIYGYMRDNFVYSAVPGSEPKTCIETLADQEGDCDDQSMLFVSLLRAADIPSWLAFGFLYDGVRDVWGAHAWAEVYVPLADGTGANVTVDVVNGEFLVRNCNRLQEWAGDGNGEHLADYYHTLVYNYTLAGQHSSAPVVSLDDSSIGTFDASEEMVHACIGWPIAAGSSAPASPRKVF